MVPKNTVKEKDSVTAIIILLLVAFIFLKSRYWVYAALALSVATVVSSRLTRFLHRIWSALTEMLGAVSGTIILTGVFIFVLIPTALLKSWFGKKEVVLTKGSRVTTFQSRNHTYTGKDLDNPW